MTTCLGKSLLFGSPCVSFVNVLTGWVCRSFPFGFENAMWDSIV